jgi:hypothetical protein
MGQRETHSRGGRTLVFLYPQVVSDRSAKARERLKDKKWDGMESMMEAHAAEALAVAKADFHEALDWEEDSIERLERILNRLCPAPSPLDPAEGEWLTILWGSYFGELLRHLHGGEWLMSVYPGSDFSVPTLEIEGARLYPTLKVHRRLSLGAGESLPAFHALMRSRLDAARKSIN